MKRGFILSFLFSFKECIKMFEFNGKKIVMNQDGEYEELVVGMEK